MSNRIIVPPGCNQEDFVVLPETPEGLSREAAMESVNADEATALEELPESQERRSFTRHVISREVFSVLTASMPPSMHPAYELITVWVRAGEAWRMDERWVRGAGTTEPLVRLDGHFNVVKGGTQ